MREPFPNDLGLFDMLGNRFEWCHDRWNAFKPRSKATYIDIVTTPEFNLEKNLRYMRGGSFPLPSGGRPLGVPQREHPVGAGRRRLFPSGEDLPLIRR